jgi:hypothetical protein
VGVGWWSGGDYVDVCFALESGFQAGCLLVSISYHRPASDLIVIKEHLTPMWSRHENAVSIVADSVDYAFNPIGRSCCENNMLWFHDMNWIEVSVEECS